MNLILHYRNPYTSIIVDEMKKKVSQRDDIEEKKRDDIEDNKKE